MLNHEIKVRGDVKLQFRASKRLNNVQDRRYATIWKMRFSEYFDDPFFFLTMFEKKTIEKQSKKHAKLCGKKTEEISTSILIPLTAQPTLRINKRINFEKWDFENIFDDPSFFLNSQCSTTKTIERKSRKHAILCSKKIKEILNSILAPLTAQTTLRINKKIDFEKWDFQHIFDDPSF